MNIEDLIWNGASEEEIQEAMNAIRAEKARQEEAIRAAKAEEALRAARAEEERQAQEMKRVEGLKAEARIYAINAILAYSEVFNLLPEGETWSEEDVAGLEKIIIKIEGLIPFYVKMFELQKKLREDGFDGMITFG